MSLEILSCKFDEPSDRAQADGLAEPAEQKRLAAGDLRSSPINSGPAIGLALIVATALLFYGAVIAIALQFGGSQ